VMCAARSTSASALETGEVLTEHDLLRRSWLQLSAQTISVHRACGTWPAVSRQHEQCCFRGLCFGAGYEVDVLVS
jgi:hypothetical protein